MELMPFDDKKMNNYIFELRTNGKLLIDRRFINHKDLTDQFINYPSIYNLRIKFFLIEKIKN